MMFHIKATENTLICSHRELGALQRRLFGGPDDVRVQSQTPDHRHTQNTAPQPHLPVSQLSLLGRILLHQMQRNKAKWCEKLQSVGSFSVCPETEKHRESVFFRFSDVDCLWSAQSSACCLQERWDFIASLLSDHPLSETCASEVLKECLKLDRISRQRQCRLPFLPGSPHCLRWGGTFDTWYRRDHREIKTHLESWDR